VTLRARWVTLRARWVTLRARWVTLRARWVTLRARWVTPGVAALLGRRLAARRAAFGLARPHGRIARRDDFRAAASDRVLHAGTILLTRAVGQLLFVVPAWALCQCRLGWPNRQNFSGLSSAGSGQNRQHNSAPISPRPHPPPDNSPQRNEARLSHALPSDQYNFLTSRLCGLMVRRWR
jgi:hypothetical protein